MERLDKLLTRAGLTRSEAKAAVKRGRVTVNGRPAKDAAAKADPADVRLDGRAIPLDEGRTLMVNKPAGVLTATSDGRAPTVCDLIPPELRRGLGPVGRLDKDAEGLVLLTTDGQLAHRLMSPRHHCEKIYRVVCEGRLEETAGESFRAGIALSDFTAKPAELTIVEASQDESVARVAVTEGKFHQVKRMFAAVGHPVKALFRERIGPVALDPALASGQWRPLTDAELAALRAAAESDNPEA